MKVFFNNLLENIKRFIRNLFIQNYGMDALNKALIIGYFVLGFINLFIKSTIVYSISSVFFIFFIFRYFSKNKYKRSEENRKYTRFIKYYKLKKQYSKTHQVYKCKCCGQFIKVPKGVGKVETTCPSCGQRETHRA